MFSKVVCCRCDRMRSIGGKGLRVDEYAPKDGVEYQYNNFSQNSSNISTADCC